MEVIQGSLFKLQVNQTTRIVGDLSKNHKTRPNDIRHLRYPKQAKSLIEKSDKG